MSLFDLDDRVVAAAVAATGTVIGALVQLRIAWRAQVSDRSRGVPATKKSRRGPVLALSLLFIAAAVGGFAFSQYLARQSDAESAALRGELKTQLTHINATAERLERATLGDRGASVHAAVDRPAAEGVTVTTTVGPCRAHADTVLDAAPACAEQEPLKVTLCASVPAAAVVTAMVLYARPEDSSQPWIGSQVAPGQDIGRARFADKTFERTDSDQSKQVCTGFASWNGDEAYSARLVVKYVIAAATSEVSNTPPAPIAGVGLPAVGGDP